MGKFLDWIVERLKQREAQKKSLAISRLLTAKKFSELEKINDELYLSDSAKAALALNKSFGKNIHKMLSETEHGKMLLENGFAEDIKYCSKLNNSSSVPYLNGNVIKLFPETDLSVSDI